jgi:hypothetical protein
VKEGVRAGVRCPLSLLSRRKRGKNARKEATRETVFYQYQPIP